MTRWNHAASGVLLVGAMLAIVAALRAGDARNAEPLPPPSVLAPTPPTRTPSTPAPASPAPAPQAPTASVPSVPVPDAPVAPNVTSGPCCPCIEYRHHGRPICCCDCNAPPEIKTVLMVKNPATCCTVPIPVCLPGCCTDEPCVWSRCGILGRGIVHYEYCCGVKIIVTFRACGDIVVSYYHA
jgi:hypothetical protein